MRKVRILSIIIFAAALVVFGMYRFHELRSEDHVGPRITMDAESITVSCTAGEEALLAGIQAQDSKDGDVSSSLLVESMSNFVEKGRRNITVAAFDSDNHVTKATREIIYEDYHSPVFSMDRPLRFPVNTEDILAGISVEDVLDGNITARIKISGDYYISTSEPGEYPMLFSVSNSAGDVVSLPVTVEIYDTSEEARKPQLLLSQYLVYTQPGVALNAWDYVQEIDMWGYSYVRGEDGVLYGSDESVITAENVSISQEIDYNTPGVYEIIYQITDAEERTGTVRLVVVVSE